MPRKEIWFWLSVPWGEYPVHIWRCAPEHGDYSTDLAFVMAKIGKEMDQHAVA